MDAFSIAICNSVITDIDYNILSTSLSLHSAGFLEHGMGFFSKSCTFFFSSSLTANVTSMTHEWLLIFSLHLAGFLAR